MNEILHALFSLQTNTYCGGLHLCLAIESCDLSQAATKITAVKI